MANQRSEMDAPSSKVNVRHSMKLLTVLATLTASTFAIAQTARPAIQSGQYTFQHKFAEQPNMESISVTAKIDGRHIVLINESDSDVFPKGVIAEGTLMWHQASKQWIIGHNNSDRLATEVGGCSDGPEVVDLTNKIYWTC